MTKYLISFPSGAMDVTEEELPAVSDASHAVVQEAKDAGVWVFGGGIDESARVHQGGAHRSTTRAIISASAASWPST